MSQFHPAFSRESLQDKVIVLTGGAKGIGQSLVELCVQHGAYVCFGDIDEKSGRDVQDAVNEAQDLPRARFVAVDVTNYQSVLVLFKTALSWHGRIDHVIANAGVVERGNWFDPALTVESVEEVPSSTVLDVNLLGCLYCARIATVYLRQNRSENEDRSLTLVSSVAGFKESPGIFVYQASKHGVLGLMRSLRKYISLPTTHNIRVNAICPWMTETGMVAGIEEAWHKANLPTNRPLDVAKVIAGVVSSAGLNGTSMYVEGGRAWEIERNLDRLQPQWLGEEPSKSLEKGQAVLGDGMDWTQ
ncbi:3-hydroxyacyl-CoA dehydrogenase [Talaromyces pinophilus]|uniref:3-hydroxyacyl-CoA dehydrogenase n=1 Tax=Talaromyces pinophilus TaxID=128442 RepID=A0A0B8N5Z7_TALPI|nr:3-oxoacyl-[acyl-carrier-protein] reductase FabG [Talaromyces pinophilus]PCG96930.1 Short-chain dehydrogenase/reductase SDR [Penicillium occitanis (nom. inval.)]PCH06645.1 hypothetical protein PENOC_022810 [Penicillium occitanis (nom. inval.)]GAM42084.1 3-hydroxyacyl-CoA dehydrogenase [Talaromyces pinophilus]